MQQLKIEKIKIFFSFSLLIMNNSRIKKKIIPEKIIRAIVELF